MKENQNVLVVFTYLHTGLDKFSSTALILTRKKVTWLKNNTNKDQCRVGIQ